MAFGKWLGGVLGWSLGGPIGGLLGFALGSVLDNVDAQKAAQEQYRPHDRSGTYDGDFNVSLLVLSAAVMKADGKTLRSELDYVRAFFEQRAGKQRTQEYMRMLRDLLKKEIPVQEVAGQIAYHMPLAMRLQLLHYLYGIAKSDGHVHSSEAALIDRIAAYLRINRADAESIKAMFYQQVDSAYTILEIDRSVSDDEVKKAYRRMAKKHHPDKVAQLGEAVQQDAKEKFQRIQEAYEQIKKERGIKG